MDVRADAAGSRRWIRRIPTVSILLLAALSHAAAAAAQEPERRTPGAGPPPALAALGALIVGTWESEESRHVHEWGVGDRLLRSRSYALRDGAWVQVAEGIWFVDEAEAGRNPIRGIHFAVGMPADRFEYRSRVEGDRVIHRLRTHGGAPLGEMVETWSFDEDRYRWVLEEAGTSERRVLMEGEYRRAGPGTPPA